MMILVIFALILLASMGSLLFSTLTYSLREFSRAKLAAELERTGQEAWLDKTVERSSDLVVATAVMRLIMNTLVVIGVLYWLHRTPLSTHLQFLVGFLIAGLITLFCSVFIPHVAAKNAAEQIIASFLPFIHGLRVALTPLIGLIRWMDRAMRGVAGNVDKSQTGQQIEQEILSVVEEGAEQGVVDKQEREMIRSVIEFRDTQAGQIMTARPEIIGLELKEATLAVVKQTLEESGHSRVPIYEGTMDHIIGILYARDLLQHLGLPPEKFDVRTAIRPAIFVPQIKPLRDLLQDFRLQKVHIAIVLDEYGGTAGLVTIEDILEELVGEISDEHEPTEPAMLKRIDDQTAEADARIYIGELDRAMGLNIPEDAGYDTLGGFISTTLGRIPAQGTTFEHNAVRYTILDAEPQKVNRVKIQILSHPPVETPAPQGVRTE